MKAGNIWIYCPTQQHQSSQPQKLPELSQHSGTVSTEPELPSLWWQDLLQGCCTPLQETKTWQHLRCTLWTTKAHLLTCLVFLKLGHISESCATYDMWLHCQTQRGQGKLNVMNGTGHKWPGGMRRRTVWRMKSRLLPAHGADASACRWGAPHLPTEEQ